MHSLIAPLMTGFALSDSAELRASGGEAFAYMKKLYYLCNRNKEGGNTLP